MQRRPYLRRFVLLFALLFIVGIGPSRDARAQADQTLYADGLQNGWENWSWASVNLSNSAPVHGGSASIRVTAAGWQALYLHHAAFNSGPYTHLSFWVHGGASGGQRLQLQGLLSGAAQPGIALDPLPANTWRQVTVSLAALGVADKSNLDGFWIQDTTGTTQPDFYVDDIRLVAAPPPSVINIRVDAGETLRTADPRLFGLNAAIWDQAFNTSATVSLLNSIENKVLRFPGGSISNEYHWATNTTLNNTWTWATSFDAFAQVARSTGAQVFVSVNYGTGTPQEAADWVRYANITKGYGFTYWEIGNENYGSWETDSNNRPYDPSTYATRARDYIAAMKAVDPAIKIGVVVVTGQDSYANYADLSAVNPRTGQTHRGWTPVLLTTLRNLGVTPDYVIYHKYAQNPGHEGDAGLLNSAHTWADDAADLRQQLSDYLGAAGANVELVCTENNSVSSRPGKQTTSLVNGLFLADSLGQILQTEFTTLVWWDLRNSQETGNNNSASLYGWRPYGDYGIVSGQNDPYPTYYVSKLLTRFARGGETIVRAASDYGLIAAYAARRTDGSLSLMVINKSATSSFNTNIAVSGYTPGTSAAVYAYGIPQDEAASTGTGSPEVAQTTFTGAGANFAYTFPPYSVTVLSLTGGTPPPPPAAPTGLSASAVSSGQINLAWTDNAGDETGFTIERSLNGSNFTTLATVGPNIRTFSNTGLSRNTLYYYRVRADSGAGSSAYSNTASARTKRK